MIALSELDEALSAALLVERGGGQLFTPAIRRLAIREATTQIAAIRPDEFSDVGVLSLDESSGAFKLNTSTYVRVRGVHGLQRSDGVVPLHMASERDMMNAPCWRGAEGQPTQWAWAKSLPHHVWVDGAVTTADKLICTVTKVDIAVTAGDTSSGAPLPRTYFSEIVMRALSIVHRRVDTAASRRQQYAGLALQSAAAHQGADDAFTPTSSYVSGEEVRRR